MMAFLIRFFETLVALSAALAEGIAMHKEASRRHPRMMGYE